MRQKKEEKQRNKYILAACIWCTQQINPLPMCVSSFNFVSLTEKCDKNLCFGIWETENWRNKQINKHQQPDSSTHDTSTYCPCVDQVSTLLASQSLRKERWQFLIYENWRERKKEIKGRICRRSLVLFHIKQQMIHNICTKLQNPTCNSFWGIFVTNFPRCITLECFLSHNIFDHSQGVYKIWRPWLS